MSHPAEKHPRSVSGTSAKPKADRAPGAVCTPYAVDAELFQAMPVGVFRCGLDGILQAVNPGLAGILGAASPEALVGMPALTFCTVASDRESWLAELRRQGSVQLHTVPARRLDGIPLWLRIYVRAVRDEAGAMSAVDGCVEDVTAEHQAVLELAHERDLLHTLMDSVPDSIYFKDAECRFTRINLAQAGLLGVAKPEEALGKNDFDFFARVHAEAAYADDTRLVRTGTPLTAKIEQARTRDGRAPWVSTTKVPVRNARGQITGLVGITRDITEQVLTADALKEKERTLSTLMSNLPGMAYRCANTAEWTMSFVSEGCLALTGHAPDALIGNRSLSYSQLIHPEDRSLVWSEVQAAVEKRQPFQLTYRIVTASGEVRWVWEKGRAVYSGTGALEALEGFVTDVTENQRMQESLRESWEWLFTTLKSIGDAVIATDQDGVITFMNPVAEVLTGWPEVEAVGRSSREVFCVVAQDSGAALPCPVTRVLQDGQAVGIHDGTVLLARDGQQRSIADSGAPIRNAAGQVTGAVLVFRDITEARRAEDERRALEEQMRHTQKLESLGILAGGIAHDFNNLLTGIMGNASLALGQLSGDSGARQNLLHIDSAAHRAADLCRQLLAYSGRGKLVLQHLDLSEIVEDMADLLQITIPKKICFLRQLARTLPAVQADPSQLRQVVMNLITNAAEAMGDHSGTISVGTDTLIVAHPLRKRNPVSDDVHRGHYVFLEVRDSGCGMDEATLNRVFEPFFSTKFTGRGLGLSAVHGIVHGHHGLIQVETAVGQGTVFRVYFPASSHPVEHLPRKGEAGVSPEKGARSTGTILLVDDEPAVQTVARQVLERAGFRVISALDGEEGVEQFRKNAAAISVVILDLTMPRKNGSEVFAEIRELCQDVPVIFSSGYGEEEIVASLPDKALAGFISKPYRAGALLEKVRESMVRR